MSIFTILISMRGKPHSKELNIPLIKALTSMPDNTVLNLSAEKFGDDDILIEPEDITNLFKALINARQVIQVTLKANQISIEGLYALMKSIHSNVRVKGLNLEYTEINAPYVATVMGIILENLELTKFKFDFQSPPVQVAAIAHLSEFIRSTEEKLIPNLSNPLESNHIELHNGHIFHSNRMHQRACALGEALHPAPLPLAIATLIGQYSNVLSTPTLLHAFQYKTYTQIPEKIEIKANVLEQPSKSKPQCCAIS